MDQNERTDASCQFGQSFTSSFIEASKNRKSVPVAESMEILDIRPYDRVNDQSRHQREVSFRASNKRKVRREMQQYPPLYLNSQASFLATEQGSPTDQAQTQARQPTLPYR